MSDLGHDFIDEARKTIVFGIDYCLKYCKNCNIPWRYINYDSQLELLECQKIKQNSLSHDKAKIINAEFRCCVCDILYTGIDYYKYSCNEYLMIKANE